MSEGLSQKSARCDCLDRAEIIALRRPELGPEATFLKADERATPTADPLPRLTDHINARSLDPNIRKLGCGKGLA
jgi:hypothetical protein